MSASKTTDRGAIRSAIRAAMAPRDKGREALALGIDSLTGGWGDEIVEAVGGPDEGARFREDRNRFATKNPELDFASQVGGALVLPGGIAGRALSKAPRASSALIGAVLGGSGGHEGDYSLEDRAKGAAVGALAGGATAGLALHAAKTGRAVASKLSGNKALLEKARADKALWDRYMIARTNGAPQNAAPKMGGTMLRDTGTRPTGPMNPKVAGGERVATAPRGTVRAPDPGEVRPGADVWERYAIKPKPQMNAGTQPPYMGERAPYTNNQPGVAGDRARPYMPGGPPANPKDRMAWIKSRRKALRNAVKDRRLSEAQKDAEANAFKTGAKIATGAGFTGAAAMEYRAQQLRAQRNGGQ